VVANKLLPLFEIARVLVRFGQIARIIASANHSVRLRTFSPAKSSQSEPMSQSLSCARASVSSRVRLPMSRFAHRRDLHNRLAVGGGLPITGFDSTGGVSYILSILAGKMLGVAGTIILLSKTKNFMCPPEFPADVLCGTPAQSPSITVWMGDTVTVPLNTVANAQH
jgi:hypothetical protein